MTFSLEDLYNLKNRDASADVVDAEAKTVQSQSNEQDAAGLSPESEDRDSQNEATEPAKRQPAIAMLTKEELRGLRNSLQETQAEVDVLRERLAGAQHGSDPFQEEMIELLRGEVTQLQTELAQRDARIEELSGCGASDITTESVEPEQVEKLAGRLEELLEDLDDKDELLGVLQNQLCASEEAYDATHDERLQLESWVEDIEERVNRRENEWQETVDELETRLLKAKEERTEVEAVIGETNNDSRCEALQRLITTLRTENEQLQKQLTTSKQEAQKSADELENQKQNGAREETVSLCQERAALARQRFELEKLKKTIEEQKAIAGSDLRIRALRDHLKEVHEENKVEEAEQKRERSLSNRLSRLWSRLDSR